MADEDAAVNADDKGWPLDQAIAENDELQIAYAQRRMVGAALVSGVGDRELASLSKRLADLSREIKTLKAEIEGVEKGIAGANAKEVAFDPSSV